ncbi:MAG: T9SS type A sorting domain-containing protein, partial [Marinoscillum sp.]
IIKSQAAYSQYVPGLGWVGPLSRIDSTRAYRMKLTSDDVLKVTGMPIDFETTTIALDSGWNWVSFLPPVGMGINEALTSLNATSDFIIKGQTAFAQYVDFQGWVGSLDFLRPNQGYLLYTDRAQNLTYPVTAENSRSVIPNARQLMLPDGWVLNPEDYEFSSNYIIRVQGSGISQGDVLGLFADGHLVGHGEAIYLDFADSYFFFVTAYSNMMEQDLVPVLHTAGHMVELDDQHLDYTGEKVFGSVREPVVLKLSSVLSTSQPTDPISLYPNPGSNETTLEISLNVEADVNIHIQNIMGQDVNTISLGTLSKGTHKVRIDREVNQTRLSSGIYFLHIEIGNDTVIKKLIWK